MKCPNCGQKNRDSATFCAHCGAKLAAEPPQATEQAPAAASSTANVAEQAKPVQAPAPEGATEKQAAAPAEPTAAPASAPLKPGTLLAGRYQVLELLASSPDHNRYRATDMAYCHSCGDEGNTSEDAYCRKCGAVLDPRRTVVLDEDLRHKSETFDIHLSVDQREYYGTFEALPQPVQKAQPAPSFRVRWGLATDQGKQRDHNEDYLEGWIYSLNGEPRMALFVVADGLGGQDSGEVASRMTTDALWQHVKQTVWEPMTRGETLDKDKLQEALRQGVLAANQTVYKARQERHSQMSSTLTTTLLVGTTVYIANVGDSRTYVFGPQGLKRITKDHSLVQRLVDTGQITPEEVYTHPRRNLIYSSIGDRPDVQLDLYTHELSQAERLVLCSDGLWEMVHEDGLEEVLLAEADPQQACLRLVKNANMAGGEDNISVIIVQLSQ